MGLQLTMECLAIWVPTSVIIGRRVGRIVHLSSVLVLANIEHRVRLKSALSLLRGATILNLRTLGIPLGSLCSVPVVSVMPAVPLVFLVLLVKPYVMTRPTTGANSLVGFGIMAI